METPQPPSLSTDPPPPTAVDPPSGALVPPLTSSEPLPPPTPAAPSPPPPSLTLPLHSNSSVASPSPSQPQDLLQQSQQKQPVASRTRSQTQSGQSPFAPSPSPSSSSSSSSSCSSVPSVQRSGMAIGVPAIRSHHPRLPSPAGYSYGSSSPFSQAFTSSGIPSPSFSQPFGSFPRSLASMAEQSPGSSASPSIQPFSGMPRSSTAMMEQQQHNSNAHFKPPVPGVQTIGTIGSLSGPSRMRASGIQHQQRLGQTIDRSISQPATNQTLNSQMFTSPGLSRPTSMSSPNAPLSAPQSAQSLQQQWMSNQGKQTHGTLFPPPSYRPHMKQNISQQKPQSPQQQQHSPSETPIQLQVSSSQQHQQQEQQHQQQNKLLQQQHHQQQQQQQHNKYITNNLQELHTHRIQQSLPQQPQQAARAHGSITQRPNNPLGQPVVIHSGPNLPITADTMETCSQILTKRSIQELVAQIDPYEMLEPEVEDVLMEIADDFVESITTAACSLAKHRRSTALEAKDILLYVERNWNMTLPGFGGDEIKCYKKPLTNDVHKERLAMIRKSMGIASDAGSTRSVAVGQIVANSKAHAGKASVPAPGSPKGS